MMGAGRHYGLSVLQSGRDGHAAIRHNSLDLHLSPVHYILLCVQDIDVCLRPVFHHRSSRNKHIPLALAAAVHLSIDQSGHAGGDDLAVHRSGEAQAHGIELRRVCLLTHASYRKRVSHAACHGKPALEGFELLEAHIVSRADLDFHLRVAACEERHHRHALSHSLSSLVVESLHISIDGAAQTGVLQLVAAVGQFLFHLLESIPRLVIIAGRGSALGIESHDPLSVGLHLLIFSRDSRELHLIVAAVHLRHHLSLTHIVAFLDQHPFNLAGHSESKVDLRGRLCAPRESRGTQFASRHSLSHIYRCGCSFLRLTAATRSGDKSAQERQHDKKIPFHKSNLKYILWIFCKSVNQHFLL